MYLLTIRAAVVVMAAAFVAAVAFALTLSADTVWQMALLYAGGAFGLAVPFFNAIIPPTTEGPPSSQDHDRR
ncbi:hypothetical protein [Planobispora rosea]|uniref:hypothetical protein n=1 Tax=Planobispora rosea TaxID=35762 RepID=UPI00083A78A5|nr:hypothetical protein [Planobispora rosea]